MNPHRPLFRLAFLLCLLCGLSERVDAATFRYLSVDELTRRSDACVVARVLDARVGWNEAGNIIVTTYTLELKETLSGDAPGGLMTLTRVGGEIDGLALGHPGMPSLATGETAVVFVLERDRDSFIISGMHQGVFHEREGGFVRELGEVDGAPSREEWLSLSDLRAAVTEARARQRLKTERRR